jgi:hypothetical protein
MLFDPGEPASDLADGSFEVANLAKQMLKFLGRRTELFAHGA